MSYDIASSYSDEPTSHIPLSADVKALLKFQENFDWKNNIHSILSHPYEALVITDSKQRIIWVNDGFTDMTGYDKAFAVGKTPHFLQGEDTREEAKTYIRHKLRRKLPFTTSIINYRQNQEAYACNVQIFPLFDQDSTLTHFIALENELQ
ncbi:MAG: PAS domain-containing protein [Thermonemataceae bacterium]